MYKPAKTLSQQIEYLHSTKRVQFNIIDEEKAKKILLRYNYVNVISPFKHHFAKKNEKNEIIKLNNNHIYERDVEFAEYYNKYKEERLKYPLMIKNIIGFETIFKSILAYNILTNNDLKDHDSLYSFLESIRNNIPLNNKRYNQKRIIKLNKSIEHLQDNIDNYADVYCFFDRMTLGESLTVFCGLPYEIQNKIFSDCQKEGISFEVDKTPDFITKTFTLVSIRNCVMHCNSLEILIRFYNPKNKVIRDSNSRKRYISLINYLCKEKDYTKMI